MQATVETALRHFLDGLTLGRPQRARNLVFVPIMLRDDEEHPCTYTPITQALRQGTTVIWETGSVANLNVRNNSGQPVFAPAGTYLCGGGQDRMLAVSIVIPERSKGKVPTRCVERDRWNPSGQHFTTPEHGSIVESSIADGSTQTSQERVWETVDHLQGTTQTESGTARLGDVYEKSRKAREDYQELTIDGLEGHLIGAFFAVFRADGECHHAALDLFGRKDLLREFFPGLRDSAALTALATLRGAGDWTMSGLQEPSETSALQEYFRLLLEALQNTPLTEERIASNRGIVRTGSASGTRLAVLEDQGHPLHVLVRSTR